MLPVLHTQTAAHLDNLDNRNSGEQAQKRNASMIFRIEQLLPNVTITTATASTASTATATSSTTSSNLASSHSQGPMAKRMRSNGRPGVYAAQYTVKDTLSSCVPTSALISLTSASTPHGSDNARVHCALKSDGLLSMSASLMRQMKLSEDIYSFNALFELHAGQLRVRIVRDVARDDEIVAWFGEELVLLMGIPFLTPLNIQGNNRYMCHLCHLTFETPHPLKIHLALGCGRSALDILWIRLHYALKAARSTATQHSPPTQPASSTSSTSSTHSPPPQPPLSLALPLPLTVPVTTSASSSLPLSNQRLSAFRPITGLSSAQPIISLPAAAAAAAASATLSYLPSISMAGAPLVGNPMNAAAQIEAIVSNMGASKQGHLCIYCGKVYSRKYGLKIHIRTHTGFKPLKCKFCLRPFGDPSNLNKHVRLHLQTQPSSSVDSNACIDVEAAETGYECRLCHKTLVRRRDLQRHMETRHGGGQTSSTQPPSCTAAPKDS